MITHVKSDIQVIVYFCVNLYQQKNLILLSLQRTFHFLFFRILVVAYIRKIIQHYSEGGFMA